MWQGLLFEFHRGRRVCFQELEGRFYQGGGRCEVHICRGWRMETSWWSYVMQSYGGTQRTIRIAPRIEGCWHRRCRDRF